MSACQTPSGPRPSYIITCRDLANANTSLAPFPSAYNILSILMKLSIELVLLDDHQNKLYSPLLYSTLLSSAIITNLHPSYLVIFIELYSLFELLVCLPFGLFVSLYLFIKGNIPTMQTIQSINSC